MRIIVDLRVLVVGEVLRGWHGVGLTWKAVNLTLILKRWNVYRVALYSVANVPVHGLKPSNAVRYSMILWAVCTRFPPPLRNIFRTRGLSKYEENRHMDVVHSSLKQYGYSMLTFWCRNYFFLILAHPVYKMWITQEPNKLELWNKLHFEEEKAKSIHHV